MAEKPRVAVFAGATATILNTPPLVTSNKARQRYGLPLLVDQAGEVLPDALWPQRLAKPVTVYVEAGSAHPLEREANAHMAPPDGYLDHQGRFTRERCSPDDVPVYQVELRPEDGLYPLPYMGRRADGRPWQPGELTGSGGVRQTFYPDAERLFAEIDRLGIGPDGTAGLLSSQARYDFYRVLPPGGFQGEVPGEDFFPYQPPEWRAEPSLRHLAHATNLVAKTLAGGRYAGALWLEGSPHVEETLYWFSLILDINRPLVGLAAERLHGSIGADGDRNIVDAVRYITSGMWDDGSGRDALGPVVIVDQLILAAREAQKGDARPGGFLATGGMGGVIGSVDFGRLRIAFRPMVRHTWRSKLRLSCLSETVPGPHGEPLAILDGEGGLRPEAMPAVFLLKYGRYPPWTKEADWPQERLIREALGWAAENHRLIGFVLEGTAPYGRAAPALERALAVAQASGAPVVRVGRGNADGVVPRGDSRLGIGGSNLTATKARMLLMAALLRLGALPRAANPEHPSERETSAIAEKITAYQEIFDTY